MAQNAYLSKIDPSWATIEPTFPLGFQIDDIHEFRKQVYELMKDDHADKGPTEGLKVIETTIPLEDGESLRVKVYIPDAKGDEISEGFPMYCMVHGGGWVMNSIDIDEPLLRKTAINSRIVCVSGNYRKAPEYKFPIPVDDVVVIVKWAINKASEFSVNLSKGFIIGGQSSGANLAAGAVTRLVKDPEIKKILTGQLLIAPLLVWPTVYPEKFKSELLSFDLGEDKHLLTKEHLLAYGRFYHDNINAGHVEASPLLAESFHDIPRTYIQVFGIDIFRDDGILYEKLLKEAGVATRLDTYVGVPHCPHAFFPDWPAVKKQQKDFVNGLDWLLLRPLK